MGIVRTAALLHEHCMASMRLLCSSELASRAARSVLRALSSLVAVKLVQKGDEPLGTANKGVCGRWDAR